MDKYEYKVCVNEMNALIAERRFAEAVDIADTIDWKRVKSVNMLCKISDLYKINRRYEESRDLLLLAYDRYPSGRSIVYSLCELELMLNEYVRALQYYNEFVAMAPRDPGRYILQYKLYEAQNVSLEERIGVLEELKKRDYREKWAYTLAALYHQAGMTARCAEECDELIAAFGDGRYVVKALELKRECASLSPEQEAKLRELMAGGREVLDAAPQEQAGQEPEGTRQEGTRQEELAPQTESAPAQEDFREAPAQEAFRETSMPQEAAPAYAWTQREPQETEQDEIRVKPMDDSQFNTVNLQKTIAAGLQELMQPEQNTEAADTQKERTTPVAPPRSGWQEIPQTPSGTADVTSQPVMAAMEPQPVVAEAETVQPQGIAGGYGQQAADGYDSQETVGGYGLQDQPGGENTVVPAGTFADGAGVIEEEEPVTYGEPVQSRPETVLAGGILPGALWQQTPEQVVSSAYDAVLAQETDGQYSMALPEDAVPEKQITGQLDLEGIMAEWERIRRDNEQKRAKENRQRVLQNTGPILERFNETSKQGVLENMEQALEEEARSRRQAQARPEGAALSDGLTKEERQRAAQAIGLDENEIGRRETDMPENTARTKMWNAAEIERAAQELARKEQSEAEQRRNTTADAAESETGAAGSRKEHMAREEGVAAMSTETPEVRGGYAEAGQRQEPDAEYGAYEEQNDAERGYADDIDSTARDYAEETDRAARDYADRSYAENADGAERRYADDIDGAARRYTDETDGVGRGYEDDTDDAEREYAGRGYAEETGASGEDDEYLRQERRGRSRRGGRHDGGEFGGRRVPEDRDGEPEDGEESVLAEQDEAPVEDTQELPEFIREKYGDPEEMSESQKRELKREIEENRSQRRSSSDEERIRAMSREERALFGPYLSEKNSRRQIMQAIDNISLAACTGNVIVTGAEGAGTLNLAKGLIREIQLTDQNFSGKVARTTGAILNRRDVVPIIDKLKNGALIVEHASALSEQSVKNLRRELEKEERGLIVLLLDTKKAMDRFLERYGDLSRNFTARVDIRALDNDTLVRYAKAYARSQDYSIDEFGVLALHTRISSMQTIDHSVTMGEVREIVDDAMYYADKKTLAHLMDILLRRRYDEDDRIILREKDFMHY